MRYGAAVGLAVFITVIRSVLHPILGEQHPYIFVYPAVLLAGMYGGLGAALLCLILGVIPAAYLFDPPVQTWSVNNIGGFLTALMVLSLIIGAAVLQRRERLAAHQAHVTARSHSTQLEREMQERHRTENALRQSEEQMRLLLESATDFAIFTIDLNGSITGWTDGASRLLGYSEGEIIGQHARALFTPEDRQQQRAEKEMKLALEQGRSEDERWHIRKDGTLFWASGVISRMELNGSPQGFVKIMRDMTARRETEMALRESEERFRRLSEFSPEPMWIVSEHRIEYANQAAQEMLGATCPEQVVGRQPFDFIHPDFHKMVRDRVAEIYSTGEPSEPLDEKFVRIDGAVIDVEAMATLIPWKGAQAVQVLLHDVTERKRHEESLLKASELHRLLLRELDHRVRNNLASLITLIEITSSGKTDVKDVTAAIRGRTQAMASVHQLLSKQHWTTVDLKSLVEILRPASAPGNLITKGPPVAIASRQATAMGMVLQELYSNSVKYGALGVPSGQVRIEWNLHEADHAERRLEMLWLERGGPTPATPEPKDSVGTGLIKGFVRSELRGQVTLTFPPEGASHRFTLKLDPQPHLEEMIA